MVKNAEVDGMFTELQLPTPSGPRVKLSEKVYAPVKEYPKVRQYTCMDVCINCSLSEMHDHVKWVWKCMIKFNAKK